MYPQSFPKPRNLTRSGVFWYSSSHQLLLAIETCIKEICFQTPQLQFNKSFHVVLNQAGLHFLEILYRHKQWRFGSNKTIYLQEFLQCPKDSKITFVLLQSKTNFPNLHADHSLPDFIHFLGKFYEDYKYLLQGSYNSLLSRAYSRPILLSTIKHCPILQKFAKLYFDVKHLEKELNRGRDEILRTLFLKKCPFWPISNAALNFWNIPCSVTFLEFYLNLILQINITPPCSQREANHSLPWSLFFGNLFSQQKLGLKLCKTLLHSMHKFLPTERHNRILVVKNSSFQVKIHNDVHMTYMYFKSFLPIPNYFEPVHSTMKPCNPTN